MYVKFLKFMIKFLEGTLLFFVIISACIYFIKDDIETRLIKHRKINDRSERSTSG